MILKNNGGDIEDLEVPDLGSEIVDKEDEESVTLGVEAEDDDEFVCHKIDYSFELDPDANTYIKKAEEHYRLFEGGGYGRGKPLNNSFTGPYNNMDHIHIDRGANTQF